MEELIKTIESNQSTIMFQYRGDITEDILHNTSGQQARFRPALNKYPPVYLDEYDMNLYELLTKQKITYITDESYATTLGKKIAAPKCTNTVVAANDAALCEP